MLRINYAESSFVIRGMSEGASRAGKKNPKQNHKNRCKTNDSISAAPVLGRFAWDILSCVSLG